MNQIEWCQVRLDITQEIQVTWRSGAGKFTRRSGRWEIYPEILEIRLLGNLIVLKPSTHRHNCFAEN